MIMKKNTPFFSIIIPCYNAQKTVEATLSSIQSQTFDDYEVIAVNNASTDDTLSVLQKYLDHFPNYRIVSEEQQGLGKARNKGIRESTGTVISFIDADDFWEPNKLERIFQLFSEDENIDLVCHDEYVRQKNNRVSINKYGPYKTYLDLLFNRSCLSPSAVTVRRELLFTVGLFSEDMKGHGVEDYDLWMKLAKAGANFYYLHEPLGSYVLHENNMSGSCDFFDRIEFVLEKHFSTLDQSNSEMVKRINKRRARFLAARGWCLQREGKIMLAYKDYLKSFKLDFFNPGLLRNLFFGYFYLFFLKIKARLSL